MATDADVPRMTAGKQDPGVIMAVGPPEHTRLRTLVAKAFTQRRVEQLRPRIRELAEGLVDALVAHGPPVDLVEHFALPLPVAVICELLGGPVTDRPKFQAWSDAVLSTTADDDGIEITFDHGDHSSVGIRERSLQVSPVWMVRGQRPGRRVVISCRIQPLPSGSLNEANEE
jgi:cytochrome P450